jgi:orotidine-5'-phosphate decarboxylase
MADAEAEQAPAGFFDRLRQAASARRSQLCIGLDPTPERIAGGAGGALQHCAEVVRRTSDVACCYKPNAAFWEQYGEDGLRALRELRERIPADIPVLYDAKRADIGSTMRAYRNAIFDTLRMDAVTVHAYHGLDSLEEFTGDADRGVFVVCRTSNPGARDLQDLSVQERPLYIRVAELAGRANRHGNVGLVVGATFPAEVALVRAQSPLPFLIPGIGAQGGDLDVAVRGAWTGDPASCLISTSRAVLYADDPGRAARSLRADINRVLAGC